MKKNIIHTILAALLLTVAIILALTAKGNFLDYKKLILSGFIAAFGVAELSLIYCKHKLGKLMMVFNIIATLICFYQITSNSYSDMLLTLPVTSLFLSGSALLMNDFNKKLNKISVILLVTSLILTINLLMNNLVSSTMFNITVVFFVLSLISTTITIIKTKAI